MWKAVGESVHCVLMIGTGYLQRGVHAEPHLPFRYAQRASVQ
jgi:hypothetical protein